MGGQRPADQAKDNNELCEGEKKLNPALSSSIKPLYHFICQQKEKEGKKHLNICPFRKPLCYICQNENKIKEGGGDLRAFYAF